MLKLFATVTTGVETTSCHTNKLAKKQAKLQKQRSEVFKQCFTGTDDQGNGPTTRLVRKLISVLETIEKLPVLLYEPSSSGFGLQILSR